MGDDYCIASEDCAFGPIGYERVRDVAPGEMIIITQEGKLVSRQVCDSSCW
jgi:amidophosphoribosyltransferase